jgi:broad specificity phosphatase PhoE
MPAEVLRLFVFARHAESTANAAHVLSSDPSRPVALTARGRVQARALGAQLANVPVDLAVGTRLLRTRQTIDIALHGRQIPVLIEPGFDELQAGDLDGAPIEAYRSWKHLHAPGQPPPSWREPRGCAPAPRECAAVPSGQNGKGHARGHSRVRPTAYRDGRRSRRVTPARHGLGQRRPLIGDVRGLT